MSETAISRELREALARRYRLVVEMGHGGIARVHLAEDLRHQLRVAVKGPQPEVAAARARSSRPARRDSMELWQHADPECAREREAIVRRRDALIRG
ncbi:MAG TPA: hypothetical protein VF981_18030 [Gemmatimonadaceae bacterium]